MNQYAHMCRMDHVEIGHSDSEHELCPLCRSNNEIAALTARVARLSAFARGMLDLHPHWECEGVQELALQQGVLIANETMGPCGDGCQCAIDCGEWPVTCYRLAPEFADNPVQS